MARSAGNIFAAVRASSLAAALAAFLPARAPAAVDGPGFFLKTGVRHFFSVGGARSRSVKLSPEDWSNANARVYSGETLTYRNMNTRLDILYAEVNALPWASVELSFGDNSFTGGTLSDCAWLDAPNDTLIMKDGERWARPDHRDYTEDGASVSGRTKYYAFDLHINVYESPALLVSDEGPAHSLDLAGGYSWYRDSASITDGVRRFSSDAAGPAGPTGPFPGFAADSRTQWSGWRGGFREQVRLSGKFSAAGSLMFGPTMQYRSESNWNLRPASAGSGFRDTAMGQLTEFSVSAAWNTFYRLQLECGYMEWIYRSVSGTRRVLYADGTSSSQKLDDVSTTRKGWFIGLNWRY